MTEEQTAATTATDTVHPTDPTPESRRRRHRWLIAATAVAAIAGMLALNTVTVDHATAGATSPSAVRVAGTELHVEDSGPRSGPVVVLLHGLGGSVHWWDAVTPVLARDHRVIRIDLLGHGRSAKPGGDRYAVSDQARLVGEVLAARGVSRAVVVGHSTGGYVATALARQRPAVVAGVALLGTGPRLSAYLSGGPSGELLTTPVVGQLVWRLRTDGLVRKALASAFGDPGHRAPDVLVADLDGMTYHALASTSRASDRYLADGSVPERLAPLGIPVLVIGGTEDQRWQPASFAEYGSVPDAEVRMLPGVGHSPMLEAPGRTSQMIMGFLDAVAGR